MARFLFVSTMDVFPWGGSEELWSQAAELLCDGHQVACSIHDWPELHPRVLAIQKRGVKIYPRNTAPSRAARLANWFLPQRFKFPPPNPFGQCFSEFQPELVIISQGGTADGLQAMRACQRHGVPYVLIVHAVPEAVFWADDRQVAELTPLYHAARRVYFISERNRHFLEMQFAARFTNAAIVRNPFNVSYQADPPWPEGNEPLRLACVARLEFYAKGQDLLLDIFARPKWRERSVQLNFFGSGPNQKILQARIAAENLHNVAFRGFISDIESVWAEHHALVLPSRQEGLPFVLVEAFLCRRPAVVSPVGGNMEMVRDGENGFVARAATADLFDEALEHLWQNRFALEQLGKNARATVERLVPEEPSKRFAEKLVSLAAGR
jgi:glycosyltransferase involved in cell wall biosynthesis